MPGLVTTSKAFSTPGIRSLLERRPDVAARVAKANMVSAIRVQSGAKRLSPVESGRMKGSINILQLDGAGLELSIGTNVVAPIPKGKRRRRAYHARAAKWKFGSPRGYIYPARQEYDTTLHHTTGEWGFFRKSISAVAKSHAAQCRKALVNAMKGGF